MDMVQRFTSGLLLAKTSVRVLRHNPKLGVFPLVSGIAGIAFVGLFLGITFGVLSIAPEGPMLVALFGAYLGTTLISSFFSAGLVHQTHEVLAGGEPSLQKGISAAWAVKRMLLIWAVISATVGVIINTIESTDSKLSLIVAVVFSVGWMMLTFFIIPTIVFEKPTVREMFSRSAKTYKQTWGETPISLLGIQVVAVVAALPLLAAGGYLFVSNVVLPGILLVLVGIVVLFLVSQTLQGVVKTTLYFYARDGIQPSEFDDVDFESLAGNESTTR